MTALEQIRFYLSNKVQVTDQDQQKYLSIHLLSNKVLDQLSLNAVKRILYLVFSSVKLAKIEYSAYFDHDAVSASVMISVRELDESKSGHMVFEKVKLACIIHVYL